MDDAASKDLTTLKNSYYSKYPYRPNITGTLTTFGNVLIDPLDQLPKIFFLFNDLNINVEGDYVLACTVINLLK